MDDGLTRIDILMSEEILDSQALKKQIAALDFVQRWEVCDSGAYMLRSCWCLKLQSRLYGKSGHVRTSILEEDGCLTVEKTGAPSEIDAYIRQRHADFLEYMRSGAFAIERQGAGANDGQQSGQ